MEGGVLVSSPPVLNWKHQFNYLEAQQYLYNREGVSKEFLTEMGDVLWEFQGRKMNRNLGRRAFQSFMNSAGLTRQWRYKRDRRSWRLETAEVRDLRWCILCGRFLQEEANINAMYCSGSCRERARQKRRNRGVYPGFMPKGPVCKGLKLDVRELEHRREQAFYLCHGKVIGEAPKVCRNWRKECRS